MSVDRATARRRSAAYRDAAREPASHAQALSGLYDAVFSGDADMDAPRSVVSESWQRSLAARVDPERRSPPVVHTPDEMSQVRAGHPLNSVMSLLRQTLVSIADEALHVMLVTDAQGLVLWREGATKLLADADRVGLIPGTRWSESAIGTNAMGTTLAVDAPVRIHSAEHLVRTYHAWTCVAAPVHDPDSGAILGAIDISGPLRTVHPALVQLVAATAQLAENQLSVQLAIADERLRMRNMPHLASLRGEAGALVTRTGRLLAGEPHGWWPDRVELGDGAERVTLRDGRRLLVEPLAEGYLLRAAPERAVSAAPERALSLRLLGDGTPSVLLNGRSVSLTLRLAELVLVLAEHPDGLSGDRLAQLLYGEDGNQTTVRGEIHRLRALLGSEVVRTGPYRLAATVDSDVASVHQALREGRVADALRGYPGQLLPRSDVSYIRQRCDELLASLRGAVLESGEADLLYEFALGDAGGTDLEAHERLVELLDRADPRRRVVSLRRARLRRE